MSKNNSNFWYYTRNEKKATLLLSGLLVILFLAPATYHFSPKTIADTERFTFQEMNLAFRTDEKPDTVKHPPPGSLFYFNPNTANAEEFRALGLPQHTVNTILKYRNKGGKFNQANDLAKIYTLAEKDFLRLAPYIQITSSKKNVISKSPKSKSTVPSRFNPNKVNEKELKQLGLSEQVIRNWLKYIQKGGIFRKPQDIQKIYGMSEKELNRLLPYIQIPTNNNGLDSPRTPSADSRYPIMHSDSVNHQIDINQANPEEWQKLRGIGPSYSNRIVNFRNKLGGFYRIEQVAETYGLPDSTFQNIRPHLRISPIFRSLNINAYDPETLQEHPYIRWKQAKVIIAYRQQHGPYKKLEDLHKVKAISPEFINKIGPYLIFDAPD